MPKENDFEPGKNVEFDPKYNENETKYLYQKEEKDHQEEEDYLEEAGDFQEDDEWDLVSDPVLAGELPPLLAVLPLHGGAPTPLLVH